MSRRQPTANQRAAAQMDDAQLRAEVFRLPREIASRQSLLAAVAREIRRRRKRARNAGRTNDEAANA